MSGLATLEDSQTLYDQITAKRGDIGAPGGSAPPIPPPTYGGDPGLTSKQDCEDLWQFVQAKRAWQEDQRLQPPLVRLWDGDMNFRGQVAGWRAVDYEFIENDTGTASIKLSLNHYLAKWVMNFKGRAKRNVIVTFDKQGYRWSGFMDHYRVVRDKGGDKYLEVIFKHDFEQVKHILCWANPFLIPEVQFPKLWVIFGPAKWCLLMTLFVNIFRLETSLWTLPDNPLDITEWMPLSFNLSKWRNIVKPFPLLTDNSNLTIVFSRFQTWFEVAKPILADAQLTVNCRRYLKGEDPHPFADAAGPLGLEGTIEEITEQLLEQIPIRNGCVIWDIVDNSGWGTGTVFGGSLLVGLIRAIVSIADDGYTESIDLVTGDPTTPSSYFNPLFLGTAPGYPWVVFDAASPYTGVESSEFIYYEATDTSFVVGEHSMPGVNEAISAGINLGGDFLTSFINTEIGLAASVDVGFVFGSAGVPPIDIPPLGGVMDAIAQIFYKDVFLAFEEVPTLRAAGLSLPIVGLDDVITGLGDFHYYEAKADADKAFTLAAQMAVRSKKWETRAKTSHTIKIADASPYIVGEPGYGHVWLGNRAGSTVPEYPVPDTVFIERVSNIKYSWDEDGPKGHELTIGYREPQDPAAKFMALVHSITAAAGTTGIL